jgi:hypothetical protein
VGRIAVNSRDAVQSLVCLPRVLHLVAYRCLWGCFISDEAAIIALFRVMNRHCSAGDTVPAGAVLVEITSTDAEEGA